MNFKFTAFTDKGTQINDTIVAKNKEFAVAMIESKGWTIEKLKIDWSSSIKNIFTANVGGVNFRDKLVLTKNLAVMFKSGLTIDDSLVIMSEQSTNVHLSKILLKIDQDIRAGKSLAEGMAAHPKVFPSLYTNIVHAAEQGGTLEESLNHLAIQMEKNYELRTKVRNALFYPILVISATTIVGVSLSVFVLPKVTRLFVTFDAELPLTTKILIAFSQLVTTQTIPLVIGVFAAIVAIIMFTRLAFFRPVWHRLVLKIPVAGRIVHYFNIALFCRTLYTLSGSGVPINQALTVTAGTLKNLRYRKALEKIAETQKTGEALGTLLRLEAELFPPIVNRMVSVGEESGNLEQILDFLAKFYEDEIDNITKNLSNVLEPLLLIIIGVAVGIVALGIITPIYQITGSFQFR